MRPIGTQICRYLRIDIPYEYQDTSNLAMASFFKYIVSSLWAEVAILVQPALDSQQPVTKLPALPRVHFVTEDF